MSQTTPYRDRQYTHYHDVAGWGQHIDADAPMRWGLASPLLDVGCGTGEKDVLWARGFQRVVGVDIADSCVGWCAKHKAEEPPSIQEYLHFVQADIRKRWPFPSHSFGGVFCSDVLEHLPQEVNWHFFEELKRVLRQGHWGVVIVPLGDAYASPDHIQRFDAHALRQYGDRLFAQHRVIVQHERVHLHLMEAI